MSNQLNSLHHEELRERIKTALVNYAPQVVMTGIGALILVAGFYGYNYYKVRQERSAREALYQVESRMEKAERNLYEQAIKAAGDKAKTLPEVEHSPATFEKNMAAAAGELEKLIGEYSGTKSAALSTSFLADMYTEYKMPDKALALLEKMNATVSGDSVVGALLKMQLAGLMSNKSQCDKAVGLYTEIEASKHQDFLMPQILLRRAACQIQLGHGDKAKGDLDRLTKDYPDSDATKSAHIYQRLLLAKEDSK